MTVPRIAAAMHESGGQLQPRWLPSGGLNLNKVSDDSYFSSISRRASTSLLRPTCLAGFLTTTASGGTRGLLCERRGYSAFQVLQDPDNPIVVPYGRTAADLVHSAPGHRRFVSVLGRVRRLQPPFARERQALDVLSTLTLRSSRRVLPTPKLGVHYTLLFALRDPGDPGPGKSPADSSSTDFNVRHSEFDQSLAAIFSVDSGPDLREGDPRPRASSRADARTAHLLRIHPFRDQNKFAVRHRDRGLQLRQIFPKTCFPARPHQRRAPGHRGGYVRACFASTGQEVLRGRSVSATIFKTSGSTLTPSDSARDYHGSRLGGSVAADRLSERDRWSLK